MSEITKLRNDVYIPKLKAMQIEKIMKMKLKKHEVKISTEIVQQRHLKNLISRFNPAATLKLKKKLMNQT